MWVIILLRRDEERNRDEEQEEKGIGPVAAAATTTANHFLSATQHFQSTMSDTLLISQPPRGHLRFLVKVLLELFPQLVYVPVDVELVRGHKDIEIIRRANRVAIVLG